MQMHKYRCLVGYNFFMFLAQPEHVQKRKSTKSTRQIREELLRLIFVTHALVLSCIPDQSRYIGP